MTKSMTAFARTSGTHFVWEIRSVNQRHLDANFRMPDEYRVLEPALRSELKTVVHRGKLECYLRVDSAISTAARPEIDEEALRRLSRLLDQVAAIGHNLAPATPLDLLRWPGVLKEREGDFDIASAEISTLFADALQQLVAMRAREGAELERMIRDRLALVQGIVASVRSKVPDISERLLSRLRERIAALDVDTDPARLETELVILAQKADVQEELDRLETHLSEAAKTLDEGGPVGRRLDFLMQELNREANTLSSKSSAAEMSIDAVELKVVIEQMREQIQNIE